MFRFSAPRDIALTSPERNQKLCALLACRERLGPIDSLSQNMRAISAHKRLNLRSSSESRLHLSRAPVKTNCDQQGAPADVRGGLARNPPAPRPFPVAPHRCSCAAASTAQASCAWIAALSSSSPPLSRSGALGLPCCLQLAAWLALSDRRVAVCRPHSLVLPTTALVAAPMSVAVLETESAALATAAREVRLLASSSHAMPIPIKTSGIGFSRTSRPRLRRNSAAGPSRV